MSSARTRLTRPTGDRRTPATEAQKYFSCCRKDLRPHGGFGGFVSSQPEKDAVLRGLGVSSSRIPPLQAISAHPPSEPAREQGMRRCWGLGGTLPIGEALWQEGICGHRVYLTSLLQPLTAGAGP